MTIDGQVNMVLREGECIKIGMSNRVPFLKWRSDNEEEAWANKLNDQLKWNSKVLMTRKVYKGKL